MKIYHLSAECYPIAKVGGLGDVVGALPKYQCKAGLQAAVALPFYNRKFVQENQFDVIFRASTLFAGERMEFEIWKEKTDKLGFELYLIRIPGLLDRENIYSYPDETEQFIAYQLCLFRLDQLVAAITGYYSLSRSSFRPGAFPAATFGFVYTAC
jgi:starch synthase